MRGSQKIIPPLKTADSSTSGLPVRLILLVLAALLAVASVALPYWSLVLYAPQYPQGLKVTAYVDRLVGDVQEVDTLNHYIGMMRLEEAAQLERSVAQGLIYGLAALTLGAAFARGFWRWLLPLPLVLFPIFFLADLAYWLWYAGHHLDPHAPLSSAIKPFTPTVLGVGKIAQFKTVASVGPGYYLALAAAGLVLAAELWTRRQERRSRTAPEGVRATEGVQGKV